MKVIEGGRLETGDRVRVNGRSATVVGAGFRTHVFRGDISVRYDDGDLDLVPADSAMPAGRPCGAAAGGKDR